MPDIPPNVSYDVPVFVTSIVVLNARQVYSLPSHALLFASVLLSCPKANDLSSKKSPSDCAFHGA